MGILDKARQIEMDSAPPAFHETESAQLTGSNLRLFSVSGHQVLENRICHF
jgi:hypothetical protein